MSSDHSNFNDFDDRADPFEKNQNQPWANRSADPENEPEIQLGADRPNSKRNSGRTGPTTPTGRATSARNATRHGLCSNTLILNHENESDWLNLFQTWLEAYAHPAENTVLHTFVLKTAQAEWFRLRAQREYDFFLNNHGIPPITAWEPFELRAYELVQRYLTTAERKFQRDYRLLEHHWKSHHKPAPVKEPKPAAKQPDPEPPKPLPRIRVINNETGESVDCQGNRYPAPPNYVSVPIIPGVYGPKHPAYEGPPPPKR